MVKNNFTIIVFFLFSLTLSPLYSEDQSQFRLESEITSAPLFYDFQNNLLATNLGTSLFLGYKAYWFSIGLEGSADYFAFKSQTSAFFFRGAYLSVHAMLSSYVLLNQYLELKWGAGGLWQRSAFEYNNSGILSQNVFGLAFLLNLKIFLPWPVLDIELINTCDLLNVYYLDNNFLGIVPHYTGGIKFNFHPGIDWGSIFLQINAFYWKYSSEIHTLDTLTFKVDVGVALHLKTPQRTYNHPDDAYFFKSVKEPVKDPEKDANKKPVKDPEKDPNKKPDKEPDKNTTIIKEIDLNEENLVKLGNAKTGEQFTFTNITFVKGSSQLDQAAQDALDKLASVFKKYKHLHLSISGYAELMGNPKKELDLSVARAEKIKSYLVTKKIEPDRLKIVQAGQLSSKKIIFTVVKN